MIGIIDSGAGNLFSVVKACEKSSIDYEICSKPMEIFSKKLLILPGVGAFPGAMHYLIVSGMRDALNEYVSKGRPVVGICLGMQLLMENSEEFGNSEGLGWISGDVKKLKGTGTLKVPNIGWNEIILNEYVSADLIDNEYNGSAFYFAHSYYCDVTKPECVHAYFDYGNKKIPAIVSNNECVLGMQFHPEISGPIGLRLFKNLINSML